MIKKDNYLPTCARACFIVNCNDVQKYCHSLFSTIECILWHFFINVFILMSFTDLCRDHIWTYTSVFLSLNVKMTVIAYKLRKN